ncbi:MAG: conjugal transfer protein TraF, partial [Rhodocyclaceae bacterium]|nr:conjugal transfer protein TraF [Rhodocyclaceae bacterium]
SEANAKVFMFDKSALYADLAQRVAWQNPDFDYNTRSPRSNAAQVERNFRDWADERKVLAELGRTHGLLFFFRGDCPYCAEQAPVLAHLRDRYRLPVLAVSLDGEGLQGFPDARPDNGISLRVTGGRGVTYTPAMYLVSRQTQEAIPIAFGVTALEELVDRIRVLTRKRPGERM